MQVKINDENFVNMNAKIWKPTLSTYEINDDYTKKNKESTMSDDIKR